MGRVRDTPRPPIPSPPPPYVSISSSRHPAQITISQDCYERYLVRPSPPAGKYPEINSTLIMARLWFLQNSYNEAAASRGSETLGVVHAAVFERFAETRKIVYPLDLGDEPFDLELSHCVVPVYWEHRWLLVYLLRPGDLLNNAFSPPPEQSRARAIVLDPSEASKGYRGKESDAFIIQFREFLAACARWKKPYSGAIERLPFSYPKVSLWEPFLALSQ